MSSLTGPTDGVVVEATHRGVPAPRLVALAHPGGQSEQRVAVVAVVLGHGAELVERDDLNPPVGDRLAQLLATQV